MIPDRSFKVSGRGAALELGRNKPLDLQLCTHRIALDSNELGRVCESYVDIAIATGCNAGEEGHLVEIRHLGQALQDRERENALP